MKGYKLFDHTADLGVEVSGKTRKELFLQAAVALFDLLVEARETKTLAARVIAIEGADLADLFVNFLREILYLFNGERLIVKDCRIRRIENRHLVAEVDCSRFDAQRHRVKTEIKAVTYHHASVRKVDGRWVGRVIFDV